jgi:ubiquinone/menaquinone biosynthesis C-methylase UbiE
MDELFVDNSFDVMTMIDVLEPFERQDAFRLLEKVQRIAREKTVSICARGNASRS